MYHVIDKKSLTLLIFQVFLPRKASYDIIHAIGFDKYRVIIRVSDDASLKSGVF